jgi:hypothetical protein
MSSRMSSQAQTGGTDRAEHLAEIRDGVPEVVAA